MPGIHGGVLRPVHASQHNLFHHTLLGLPLYLFCKGLNILGMHLVLQPERIAEKRNEAAQVLHLLLIGFVVNSIDAGGLAFGKKLSDSLVGCDHELLNEEVRPSSFALEDLLGAALQVKHDFSLWKIEIQAASF